MTGLPARTMTILATVLILLLLGVSPALGHSGEGVSLEHVVVEIGTWALAVAAVIAAIVGVFWVRARRQASDE